MTNNIPHENWSSSDSIHVIAFKIGWEKHVVLPRNQHWSMFAIISKWQIFKFRTWITQKRPYSLTIFFHRLVEGVNMILQTKFYKILWCRFWVIRLFKMADFRQFLNFLIRIMIQIITKFLVWIGLHKVHMQDFFQISTATFDWDINKTKISPHVKHRKPNF